MYGLWMTVHNRMLDGRIRFIYKCTGININIYFIRKTLICLSPLISVLSADYG
jgi:hypothetical protein